MAEGLRRLGQMLGEEWEITTSYADATTLGGQAANGVDHMVGLRDHASGAVVPVAVETKAALTPAAARRLAFERQMRMPAQLAEGTTALVLARWLSPRTRQILDDAGYGYLDLTGNISLRLRRPRVLLHLHGADRDPDPVLRARGRGLGGALAGRLVRLLVDVAPPYRVADLEQASGLHPSHISRLLTAMEEEALLVRDGRRGPVVEVHWERLLRARAEVCNLLRPGDYLPMLAPRGTDPILAALRAHRLAQPPSPLGELAVTGPVAAAVVAPVTVGGQLMLYVPSSQLPLEAVGRDLGLLPVRDGANTILITPLDEGVLSRARTVDGVAHVALSQLSLDCLSGPGRMPAEGDAVVQAMAADETAWRLPGLSVRT